MYYVYLLKSSKNGETYVGSTNDLKRRVEEHNSGHSASTRRYMPWTLLYYEAYIDEHMARIRESRLKHNGNAIRELKKRVGLDSHKSGAGFTLIEILIVIAIFTVLIALGLFMSMETFKGSMYRSEEATIVSLLQKARSRAMANVFQTAWSVCYSAPNYIIAHGSGCPAGAYDTVAANAGVATVSDFANVAKFPTVVFQQLSGDTTSASDVSITVVQDSISRPITINHEGAIIW